MEGLHYAFPRAMGKMRYKNLARLHKAVGERKKLKSYLMSKRRIPFNQSGLFRYYPELDG
jgi:glutathione S-transferase